jgi:alkylhydroperoxidase family enzyme
MTRISPVDEADLPASYDVIERQRDALSDRIDSAFWNRQPTVQTFSNNPELGELHVTANTFMWTETGLSGTESEAAIMTVARELDCELLWHDHVGLAVEHDRLSTDQILAIADRETGAFDDSLGALVEYTVEYVSEQGAVGDETHEALAAHYDDDQVVGVVMLAGFYLSLSHEVRALGLTRDGFVGWHLEGYDHEG